MARSSVHPFVWVGLTAAALLGAVLAVNLLENGAASPPPEARPIVDTAEPERVAPRPQRPLAPAKPEEAAVRAGAQVDAPTPAVAPTSRGLEIYREQALEDQRHLGREYADLERLWKEGRFGGNSPGAEQALEQLVERYGDTHRGACARYLLARQKLGRGTEGIEARRDRADQSLRAMIDGDADSRCDTGTRAVDLAKFFLATQVYRHSDWERSVQVLEEIAEIDADAVDNLGVPLPLRARAILKEVEELQK